MMLTYDPSRYIQEVVLVGCGGTGAQIARTLARIIRMMQDTGKSTPTLRFVDPDVVETKNVGRQLYTDANVGMYKSVELARRFNYALGLEIDVNFKLPVEKANFPSQLWKKFSNLLPNCT